MLYINIRPGSKGAAVFIVTYGTTRCARIRRIRHYIIGYVVARCAVMLMAVKVVNMTRRTVSRERVAESGADKGIVT